MIKLTRLNHKPIYVNPDLIEHLDASPDTVLSLTSGQKLLVIESPEEICAKVIAFRRSILEGDLSSYKSSGDLEHRDSRHG